MINGLKPTDTRFEPSGPYYWKDQIATIVTPLMSRDIDLLHFRRTKDEATRKQLVDSIGGQYAEHTFKRQVASVVESIRRGYNELYWERVNEEYDKIYDSQSP
jgi:hypothetical protein